MQGTPAVPHGVLHCHRALPGAPGSLWGRLRAGHGWGQWQRVPCRWFLLDELLGAPLMCWHSGGDGTGSGRGQQGAGARVWHTALAALSSGAQGPAGPARGAVVEKALTSCRRKWRPVSSPSASCRLLGSRAVPGQLLPCCHGAEQRSVPALFPRPPHSCHCRRKCRSEREALMLLGDGTKLGLPILLLGRAQGSL